MGVTRLCGTIAQPSGSIDQCKHLYLVLRCSVLDMTIRFSRSYQFQHPSSISTPHPILYNPLITITHTVPSASLSSYTSRPKHCYFSASIPEPPASPATTRRRVVRAHRGRQDGIGSDLAQELLSHNFSVVLYGRNAHKFSKLQCKRSM